MENHVVTEIVGPVAHVRLNRPDKLNGITFDMIDGLIAAANEIEANRDVRVVLLEGTGPSFCAGLDFGEVFTQQSKIKKYFLAHPLKGLNKFQEPAWIWRTVSVPVIAVTHGHVFGGGIQLALGADFRFTTPDCKWSIMEAKWGLVPDMGGTVPLAELVPADLAKRLVFTGEIFSGQQAADWGIATGVAEDPLVPAMELVEKILERSPDSVANSKRLMNKLYRASARAALRTERRMQVPLLKLTNTKEARRAGAEKTAPNFGPREV